MLKALRILIVDDQARTRASLRALLGMQLPLEEVHEAGDGVEALGKVERYGPNLVLMDVRMPGMDGIEATRVIKLRAPGTKVIVLSLYPEYRQAALLAGADAFVGKGEPPEQLLAVLTTVATSA